MTKTVVLVNCANMGASGILVRGKRISDDWQLHAEGCRDLKEMRRIFGRFNPAAFDAPVESIDAARDAFNADMGGGGEAGFEEGTGWDFDRDVTVKPCCR